MGLSPALNERDHRSGDTEDPYVELLQFGDYQCPYCRQAHEVVRSLEKRFGSRLLFAFRNLPLTDIHPHALRAAMLAEGAAQAGRFWDMHDWLFENQNAIGTDASLKYAIELGARINDHQAAIAKIRSDMESAERSGVVGTPTFFLNGRLIEIGWDEETLTKMIQQALMQAGGSRRDISVHM